MLFVSANNISYIGTVFKLRTSFSRDDVFLKMLVKDPGNTRAIASILFFKVNYPMD